MNEIKVIMNTKYLLSFTIFSIIRSKLLLIVFICLVVVDLITISKSSSILSYPVAFVILYPLLLSISLYFSWKKYKTKEIHLKLLANHIDFSYGTFNRYVKLADIKSYSVYHNLVVLSIIPNDFLFVVNNSKQLNLIEEYFATNQIVRTNINVKFEIIILMLIPLLILLRTILVIYIN